MQIIFGNYGDNTMALIQWTHLHCLQNVTVVHVETGSMAIPWEQRIRAGQLLATSYHFNTVSLKPMATFADLVRDRQSFPNQKNPFCVTFLKILPFLTWLDEVDSSCSATVLLGSRRADSRARLKLPECVEESEHYGERRVCYPLCSISNQQRDDLIRQAGFSPLNHRSLECDPCIHSTLHDLSLLEIGTMHRILQLEQEVNEMMFQSRFPDKTIFELVAFAKDQASERQDHHLEQFDMGCGSNFACGE